VFVPGKSPVKMQSEILDIFLGELHIVYLDQGGWHVSLRVVNMTWIDLNPLAFILHFLNQFWIASRLVCSFCEAMARSLSVATTAASSAEAAVVNSGEVGRSSAYRWYNDDPRTLPWDTPALTVDSSVYSVSTFMRKCVLCR
jgi:hypothetical protein